MEIRAGEGKGNDSPHPVRRITAPFAAFRAEVAGSDPIAMETNPQFRTGAGTSSTAWRVKVSPGLGCWPGSIASAVINPR